MIIFYYWPIIQLVNILEYGHKSDHTSFTDTTIDNKFKFTNAMLSRLGANSGMYIFHTFSYILDAKKLQIY